MATQYHTQRTKKTRPLVAGGNPKALDKTKSQPLTGWLSSDPRIQPSAITASSLRVPARVQAWWRCPKWPLAWVQERVPGTLGVAWERAAGLLACCMRSENLPGW